MTLFQNYAFLYKENPDLNEFFPSVRWLFSVCKEVIVHLKSPPSRVKIKLKSYTKFKVLEHFKGSMTSL